MQCSAIALWVSGHIRVAAILVVVLLIHQCKLKTINVYPGEVLHLYFLFNFFDKIIEMSNRNMVNPSVNNSTSGEESKSGQTDPVTPAAQ